MVTDFCEEIRAPTSAPIGDAREKDVQRRKAVAETFEKTERTLVQG